MLAFLYVHHPHQHLHSHLSHLNKEHQTMMLVHFSSGKGAGLIGCIGGGWSLYVDTAKLRLGLWFHDDDTHFWDFRSNLVHISCLKSISLTPSFCRIFALSPSELVTEIIRPTFGIAFQQNLQKMTFGRVFGASWISYLLDLCMIHKAQESF